MPRPQPEQFPTRAAYRWALRNWRRRHGGSLIAVLAIAFVVGALTSSQVLLWGLVIVAIGAWSYMRTRP